MNMEGTAVLLSIRPEWCQKIFRGEKTIWLASAAVAVACILKTGNADFLQILAFPFFVCILT